MSALPFISFQHAERLVKTALSAGLSIKLSGSPSSGKTAIGYKIARENDLVPIVFSLMDHEPTDICGLPDLSGEKATFKPFDTFPLEGEELPEGKRGWLVMLDEHSSGTRAMQAASNKLLYERMVGNKPLHPLCAVMAMGNLATDNAYVIEEPAHTKSRMAHLYVQQDIGEWVDWAFKAELDSRVISYAEMKPTLITKYDPEHVDINYPCARTMEMLSDVIKGESVDRPLLPLVQGILGQGAGLEFYNFCQLKDELPTIQEILAEPTTTLVPTKTNHLYALCNLISEHFTPEQATTLMDYILRLPTDKQYFIFRAAVMRDPKLIRHEGLSDWCMQISEKYMM